MSPCLPLSHTFPLQVALTDSKVERMRKAQWPVDEKRESVDYFVGTKNWHKGNYKDLSGWMIWMWLVSWIQWICQSSSILTTSPLSSLSSPDAGSNATFGRQSGARFWCLGWVISSTEFDSRASHPKVVAANCWAFQLPTWKSVAGLRKLREKAKRKS